MRDSDQHKKPPHWKKTILGDRVVIGRGSSPRPIHNYLTTDGIPWVKIADATASQSRFIEKTREFIKEEGRSTSVSKGDLIVSNSATPGIPKFMAIDACVHDGWLVFSEYSNLDKLYLYYFFLDYRRRIEYSASGTVFKNLKIDIVNNIELYLPPLPEQKAIAKVLSCLDDKIEILRKQNETLENIAQTLFKEWFVNFNFPNKDGKPYKDSGGKMVNSELGEIPEGWEVIPIYDIARYLNGAAFKPSELNKDKKGLPVIKIAELKSGITDQTYYSAKQINNDLVISRGDVLFSWSGSPETSIDIFLWVEGEGLLNQHTFRIIADKGYDKAWVYFQLKHLKPLFIHYAKQKQTTGLGHVTVDNLKYHPIAVPSKAAFNVCNNSLNSIFDKLLCNYIQIQTLSKLRDTLLPKLMSGEIRVKH